jgi:hypothetical protein
MRFRSNTPARDSDIVAGTLATKRLGERRCAPRRNRDRTSAGVISAETRSGHDRSTWRIHLTPSPSRRTNRGSAQRHLPRDDASPDYDCDRRTGRCLGFATTRERHPNCEPSGAMAAQGPGGGAHRARASAVFVSIMPQFASHDTAGAALRDQVVLDRGTDGIRYGTYRASIGWRHFVARQDCAGLRRLLTGIGSGGVDCGLQSSPSDAMACFFGRRPRRIIR